MYVFLSDKPDLPGCGEDCLNRLLMIEWCVKFLLSLLDTSAFYLWLNETKNNTKDKWFLELLSEMLQERKSTCRYKCMRSK